MTDAGNTETTPAPLQALVVHSRPEDALRAGRTVRSLRAAGISDTDIRHCVGEDLASLLRGGRPILLLAAGAWLVDPHAWSLPPASATGKGLCALGAVRAERPRPISRVDAPGIQGDNPASAWARILSQTGGDLNRLTDTTSLISIEPQALFLDAAASVALADRASALACQLVGAALSTLRVIHLAALDVRCDPNLRVMQVITSLQRGGAERVTLDLVAEMPGVGVTPRLATWGRPSREAFPIPPGTLDLAGAATGFDSRAAVLVRHSVTQGIDLVHAHLVPSELIRCLSSAGLPTMATVHNTRVAWPLGLAELQSAEAVLLAACAGAVQADLRAAAVRVPVRIARNGFDYRQFRLTPERLAGRSAWRRRWSFGDTDFVLVAVANPRPQKRLHLLPAILAELRQQLGPDREARLVLCGEPMRGNPQAAESVALTQSEITRLELAPHVRWAGAVTEVADLLAATDVMVSTSAHEGLSLAFLESLAMGCPVVATDVGGAREIARDNPNLHLLPLEASAQAFVEPLLRLARAPTASGPELSTAPSETFLRNWSSHRMAARYHELYRRAITAAGQAGTGRGIWLVTNNFSTGGAQSSARRLLLALAGQGVRVRAAVIEEQPDNPTPGRRALLQAGVAVLCAGPANQVTSTAASLLHAIDADPPRSVLFWNLRPSFRILLADALLNIPVFDISPGEMFFDSLEQHFARTDGPWPCRTAREYGALLAGVIVKYQAEAPRAADVLGAPVFVVPNGVPVPGGGDEPPPPLPGRLIFGTAARLSPQKRLEDLLAAFRLASPELPPWTLRIAGGAENGCDDYAAGLRQSGDGLPIEWLGETADLATFHRGLDAFVMISEPAGCPNASLEAMAAGLPVIATAVGGASEQVIDGQTGRLVAPRDPACLAAAIIDLACHPAARLAMGKAARERIQQYFTVDRMVTDYRRVCRLAE